MKGIKKKKTLLAAVSLVLVAAIGAGIFLVTRGGGEPVNVYPFHYVGMTEYWGDSRESYGPVTTDKIQTVFLSDTQIVTEILVQPGDAVKKGDVLMTFDTTLDDLALERKRLAVEKLKLQQTAAREELAEIQNLQPVELTGLEDSSSEYQEPDLGTALTGSYRLSSAKEYDGSSPETAMICWLKDTSVVNEALLEAIRRQSEVLRNTKARSASSNASAVPEEIVEEILEEIPEEIVEIIEEEVEVIPEEIPEVTEEIPEATEEIPEQTEPPEPEDPPETQPPQTDPLAPTETEPKETEPTQPILLPEDVPVEAPSGENVESYYVVFKVTTDNMSLGNREVWQGVQVFGDSTMGFSLKFFNAAAVPDHTLETQEESDFLTPEVDTGSGYTAAQIAQMRSEQEKKIAKLQLDIRMAEAEYQIMRTEMDDGHVYAKIDGQVVSVLTEEEARSGQQPLVKVSDGGGFYVNVTISELEKDGIELDQTVTVNDWNTGMTYEGRVVELGDFPSDQDGWNGIGNPNVSYYPFKVFVDGEADLREGSYVSVMYSTSAAEHGIYLENAFLRTEQGRSYVYVRGSDGKLEKRYVRVGKSLWGSYREILGDFSEEDLLAFPYGKDVKEGAPTVEAEISALYSY